MGVILTTYSTDWDDAPRTGDTEDIANLQNLRRYWVKKRISKQQLTIEKDITQVVFLMWTSISEKEHKHSEHHDFYGT